MIINSFKICFCKQDCVENRTTKYATLSIQCGLTYDSCKGLFCLVVPSKCRSWKNAPTNIYQEMSSIGPVTHCSELSLSLIQGEIIRLQKGTAIPNTMKSLIQRPEVNLGREICTNTTKKCPMDLSQVISTEFLTSRLNQRNLLYRQQVNENISSIFQAFSPEKIGLASNTMLPVCLRQLGSLLTRTSISL